MLKPLVELNIINPVSGQIDLHAINCDKYYHAFSFWQERMLNIHGDLRYDILGEN